MDKYRGNFFSWSPVHTMIFFFCINFFCVWRETVPSAVCSLYFDHKTNTYYHQNVMFFLITGPSITASLCSVLNHRGIACHQLSSALFIAGLSLSTSLCSNLITGLHLSLICALLCSVLIGVEIITNIFCAMFPLYRNWLSQNMYCVWIYTANRNN